MPEGEMYKVECCRMAEINAEADAIERMRKDAARYRWLRDVGDATWRPFALREGHSAKMADEAIDAAMIKTPNVELTGAKPEGEASGSAQG